MALVHVWRKIRTGKAGGPDGIPPNVLKEVPYDVFVRTHELFEKRLWGQDGGRTVDPWNKTNMCLLPKKGDLSNLSKWRPISLCCVLWKLYECYLWTNIDVWAPPLPKEIFGFRPHRQAEDVVGFLAELIRRTNEWNEPLYVVNCDVKKAFDFLDATEGEETLKRRGIPTFLRLAYLREYRDIGAKILLGGTETTQYVPIEGGQRQGGPRTPRMWNEFMALLVDDLRTLWDRVPAWTGDMAREDELTKWSCIIYADNIWLVGNAPRNLVARASYIDQWLHDRGLSLGADSLQYLRNQACGRTDDLAQETDRRLPHSGTLQPVAHLDVLGVRMDGTADTNTMVEHRMATARKVAWAHRTKLRDTAVPARLRVGLWYKTVAQSVLWGSTAWTPLADIRERIERYYVREIREVLHGRRVGGQDPEQIVEWLHQTKIMDRELLHTWGFTPLAEKADANIWTWAGHVARQDAEVFPAASAWTWRTKGWQRDAKKRRVGRTRTVHPVSTYKRTTEACIDSFFRTRPCCTRGHNSRNQINWRHWTEKEMWNAMVDEWVDIRKHSERAKLGRTERTVSPDTAAWLEHAYPPGLSHEPNNLLAGFNRLVFLETNAARDWEQKERANLRRPLAVDGLSWVFSTPPKRRRLE